MMAIQFNYQHLRKNTGTPKAINPPEKKKQHLLSEPSHHAALRVARLLLNLAIKRIHLSHHILRRSILRLLYTAHAVMDTCLAYFLHS